MAGETVAEAGARFDGALTNALTGMGTSRDRMAYVQVDGSLNLLTEPELNALYIKSWLCRRVVDLHASEATRSGWDLGLGDDKAKTRKQSDQLVAYGEKLHVRAVMRTAVTNARLHGGGAVIMVCDDGRTPYSEPINWKRLKAIRALYPMDRWRLWPAPGWSGVGMPEQYQFLTQRDADLERIGMADSTGQIIHASRVLRVEGEPVPWQVKSRVNWWGASILEALMAVFKRYETGQTSAADILHDFDLVTHKIPDLRRMLGQPDGQEQLSARLRANALARSVFGAYILGDNEELGNLNRTAAGIADLLDRIKGEVTAAARIPHTKLWGESPGGGGAGGGGMGQSGRSEDRQMAAEIGVWQEDNLQQPLRQLYGTLMRCSEGPWKAPEPPEDWKINFRPTFTLTDDERADLYGKVANADAAWINAQVLKPNEVALARFGRPEFSLDTSLIDREPDGSIKVEEQDPNAISFGGDLGAPPLEGEGGQGGEQGQLPIGGAGAAQEGGPAAPGAPAGPGAPAAPAAAGGEDPAEAPPAPTGGRTLEGEEPEEVDPRRQQLDSADRDDACCPACEETGGSCGGDPEDGEEEALKDAQGADDPDKHDHPDIVGQTMHRWKHGTLHSGTGRKGEHRGEVGYPDNQKQAIAIALSIAERQKGRRAKGRGRRRNTRADGLPLEGRQTVALVPLEVRADGTAQLVGPYGQLLPIHAAVGPDPAGAWEVLLPDALEPLVVAGIERRDALDALLPPGSAARPLDAIDLVAMGVRVDAYGPEA